MQQEPTVYPVKSPLPRQVVQRTGHIPRHAHESNVDGPSLGRGLVPVVWECPRVRGAEFEYRTLLDLGANGKETGWRAMEGKATEDVYTGKAEVEAGGWYRIEVRCRVADLTIGIGAVEPVGVGEVFLIAGQSYAEGANEELNHIDDPYGRAVAYSVLSKNWTVANDPQPNLTARGTIWPAFANALLPILRVPVGLANVARSATSTRQWLPGTTHFRNLVEAALGVGQFRAVLWQQGESDILEGTSTEVYARNLYSMRSRLVRDVGFQHIWMPAKSTLHPTVYTEPDREAAIRAAIDQLWRTPGFRPGPDTDVLGGENRAPEDRGGHFSTLGQQRAGLMWFAAVLNEIYRQDYTRED